MRLLYSSMRKLPKYCQFNCFFSTSDDNLLKLVMTRMQKQAQEIEQNQKKLIAYSNGQLNERINPDEIRIKIDSGSQLLSVYTNLNQIMSNISETHKMMAQTSDSELKSFLQEELAELIDRQNNLKDKALSLLIPSDPYDKYNQVNVELRQGAGGSQSAIFVNDISQMLCSYAQNKGWKVAFLELHKEKTVSQGYKSMKIQINGENAYKYLKCESGVHKVIRVPQTQAKGRLHSSTISVVIMPKIPFSYRVNQKDIKYQYTTSCGPGGQAVNKVESACRAIHIPTGLSVLIQEEKSQQQNRKRATDILKQRLFEAEYHKSMEAEANNRKKQIGTMDRSEKIRTYNYPQNRITDHRTGLTIFGIQDMMSGSLLPKFIEQFQKKVAQQKLKALIQELSGY